MAELPGMPGMLANLGNNQMFGAGFGLFAMGVAATMAKRGAQVMGEVVVTVVQVGLVLVVTVRR